MAAGAAGKGAWQGQVGQLAGNLLLFLLLLFFFAEVAATIPSPTPAPLLVCLVLRWVFFLLFIPFNKV